MGVSFELVLFGIFAGLAVILAIFMLAVKSPIHAALCLVGVMANLAILYIMLHAFLLGVVQVVVYAGAVMVLFLFVLMFFYKPKMDTLVHRRAHIAQNRNWRSGWRS